MSAVDTVLFTKSLEFAGVFRDGDLTTKPFSIDIRYSPLNAHPPIGIIRGTAADWPELNSFFHAHQSPVCELESVSAAQGREKVRSRQVLLREMSARIYPDDESKIIQQILGRFEPYDITIDCDYGQRGMGNRQMTLLLTGPTLVWMSDAIRTFSYLGSTKTEFRSANLRISEVGDLAITAQPHFLYAGRREAERLLPPHEDRYRALEKLHLSVEAEAFSLTLTDRDLERTDSNFEARALEVAEVLCLLVSFLSKSNVTWYARTLWSDGRLLEQYRGDTRESSNWRVRWEDIVLPSRDVRRFINGAFTAYEKRSLEGMRLRLPILIYLAAQSAPTVDEQFTLLFSCLEKIVSSLDLKYPWEVISPKELRTIDQYLRSQLTDMGKNPQTVSVISAKISELARPAFRQRLNKHLKRLKVNLDDIGGHDALRCTIRIRNSLVHGAEEVAIAVIVQEQKRLQTVVERIMLALLDWRGPTNTPTLANRLAPAG